MYHLIVIIIVVCGWIRIVSRDSFLEIAGKSDHEVHSVGNLESDNTSQSALIIEARVAEAWNNTRAAVHVCNGVCLPYAWSV